MSKRPTIVKQATEGSKKIVMKEWKESNSGVDKYEIDSIEQVMPSGSILMNFENTRAEMEKTIGAKNLQSVNLWICPPVENFDKIINQGCENTLSDFNAFFTKDVHIAIKDGYHPYRVILCRVVLGREGRDYVVKYGKYLLKKVCAIPAFIVTFTVCIDEVVARSSVAQKDEVYEQLINNSHLAVSKENLVVDIDDEKPLTQSNSKPISQPSSQPVTPQKTMKLEGQKFCDNCGELCPASSKFCGSCGHKF
ncbi:hypothetical protein ENUP19_0092G0033 [Entamoeba nuttalli]|uniref:Zinc-ribbon domain-containing protein n=2 Tax=Entamoeba nuttalli TaxID=412467 RepID=K2GG41_ENTNP|nr:hypothetical protein ENU1_048970 [Entamoeba nuttalli P19]EKE41641.1 hypothetical protein ENU1_048970 [Entamoeba nuttalli P19]|eukprot:XP_008856024.1 hypothetical protein ENU1_048970 [Entamoeba nuttalli P19]